MAGHPTLAVHISLTLRLKSVYANLAEELLATVIAFLLFRITRALAWPFCPIYPIGCFSFRLENSGELLGITFRDIPTMVQCLLQDFTQDVNPLIGCTLHHTK